MIPCLLYPRRTCCLPLERMDIEVRGGKTVAFWKGSRESRPVEKIKSCTWEGDGARTDGENANSDLVSVINPECSPLMVTFMEIIRNIFS